MPCESELPLSIPILLGVFSVFLLLFFTVLGMCVRGKMIEEKYELLASSTRSQGADEEGIVGEEGEGE